MTPPRTIGSPQHRRRVLRTVAGVAVWISGLWAFKTSPEHGATLAILLCSIGTYLVEPSLVERFFRSKQP